MGAPGKIIKRIRAKKLIKALEKHGGNMSAVAREEGVTQPAISSRIKNNAPAMVDLLDKAGVTDKVLARTIKEGLKAKDTKFFAMEGVVQDERTTVDHVTRHKYAETALKLRGHLASESKEGSKSITWIQILNGIETPLPTQEITFAELINGLEARLKNQLP